MGSILADAPKAEPSQFFAEPRAGSSTGVIANLLVDERPGLNDQAVVERRRIHGYNELDEAPPVSLWNKFLRQFTELVIVILIVAAVISGPLGEWSDASGAPTLSAG